MSLRVNGEKPAEHAERAFWLYAFVLLASTAISWVSYLHFNTFDRRPFFRYGDQFRDLTNYIGKTAHLYHGAAVLGSTKLPIYNYPAPAAFIWKILLYSWPGHPLLPYLFFVVTAIGTFSCLLWKTIRISGRVPTAGTAAIIATALLGEPHLFAADRGNIEIVVWAISAAALCFLLRGRNGTAAVILGIAGAIKPFALLFMLLLVRRRQLKDAAVCLSTTVLLTVSALIVLGPNPWRAYQSLTPGVTAYTMNYVLRLIPLDELRFAHSLLDGLKAIALSIEMGGIHPTLAISQVDKIRATPGLWPPMPALLITYVLLAICGIVMGLAIFEKRPILNQLTAIAIAATLIPPVSAEYTLLQLYVPFGAFLVFAVRDLASGNAHLPSRALPTIAVIYGLLFAPLTFLRFYAGTTKLLLILILLVAVAIWPMPSRYFGDDTASISNQPIETAS